MPTLSRTSRPTARIRLQDAYELSRAASLCAATKREARRFPGSFARPVVGSDPQYFANAATRVYRKAVKKDPELGRLYLRAWSLSSRIEQSTNPPYNISGVDVDASVELTSTAVAINSLVEEKDLRLELSGKHLERATAISAFALRVIQTPIENPFISVVMQGRHGLYPGLPADTPANTADYWLSLQEQLTSAHVAQQAV